MTWFKVSSRFYASPYYAQLANHVQRWVLLVMEGLANESPRRGWLRVAPGVGYTAERLARAAGLGSESLDDVSECLARLSEMEAIRVEGEWIEMVRFVESQQEKTSWFRMNTTIMADSVVRLAGSTAMRWTLVFLRALMADEGGTGRIRLAPGVPYSAMVLARICEIGEDEAVVTLQTGLDLLRDTGLLQVVDEWWTLTGFADELKTARAWGRKRQSRLTRRQAESPTQGLDGQGLLVDWPSRPAGPDLDVPQPPRTTSEPLSQNMEHSPVESHNVTDGHAMSQDVPLGHLDKTRLDKIRLDEKMNPVSGSTDMRNAWNNMIKSLARTMDERTMAVWLNGAHPVEVSDGQLTIGVRSQYACEWLRERWYAQVVAAAIAAYGSSGLQRVSRVRFLVRASG